MLEGSASRAIEGLPVAEENYHSAVEILKKRFGKPQQRISAHMEELLKLNVCVVDKPSQLRYLCKRSEPEIYDLLRKSLYVDDLLTGEDNDESGFFVYQKSKKIMATGGFNLRKWNTNSQTLLKSIETCESLQEQRGSVDHATAEDDDESYAKSSITPGNSETKNDTVAKVLGMNWDTVEDNFFFNFTDLCDYGMSPPATKRSVLNLSAMAFDPMGFRTLNIRTIIVLS